MVGVVTFIVILWFSVQIKAQEIILFNAANKSKVFDTKTRFGFANFVQIQQSYLNVTPFDILKVKNEKVCHIRCVQAINCISYNIAAFPNSNGQFECELLNTDMFNASGNLIKENPLFLHFFINTGCLSRPCQNRAQCVPNYNDGSYLCRCLLAFSGTHCETNVCSSYLPYGMEDGRILDSQISASSYYSDKVFPWHGRLNRHIEGGSWKADSQKINEFLQIDLTAMKIVAKVATQGRNNGKQQWTTNYVLMHSEHAIKWEGCCDGVVEEFSGNTDETTVVSHVLDYPFLARHVRFVVKAFNNIIAMRVEVYGC